jgi:hypothetical protein
MVRRASRIIRGETVSDRLKKREREITSLSSLSDLPLYS